MDYIVLAEKVKNHVLLLFKTHDASKFLYHSRLHTEQVVKVAAEIAGYYHLNEKDFFIVTTAAWFHDTGYFEQVSGHEVVGAKKAELFLKDQQIEDATIQAVKGCILATQLPQKPVNLLEEIICDADLYDLGTDDFIKRSKLLRQETALLNHKVIGKRKWFKKTLRLLEDHHYFTDYCRQNLNRNKQEHIKDLKNKLGERQEVPAYVYANSTEHTESAIENTDEVKKKHRPNKSMETMFRISSSNNQRLSYMADTKAHIMITVNSIIISVLLSVFAKKLEDDTYLTVPATLLIPITLLLLVNLVTIVFSMLATRPHLPQGRFTQNDIDDKKINLLFFGNYYRMDFDAYYSGIMKVMDDPEFLYLSLTRDVYQQGIVLSKKYRMLKIAYAVFMYGLVGAVVVFLIVARFH